MEYRKLGNTGLMVSAIGLGGEQLERHGYDRVKAVIDRCHEAGINIIDCWMSNPEVRSHIGEAIKDCREDWIIQGHFGSAWENGQYLRTRDMAKMKAAFEDQLERLQTEYIDLGMIHFVDDREDWETIVNGEFLQYVKEQKAKGVIRHIGLSTHSPEIAKLAVESGIVEMLLFSVNPAFDMLPASVNWTGMFNESAYENQLFGMDPDRESLYKLCEERGVGITVMQALAGGRLLKASASPFGVAMNVLQCTHYCLTRPAVASVLLGYDSCGELDEALRYLTATEEEKDYVSVLKSASRHALTGECTYCGHCRPCPKGIDIAMVNKYYDLAAVHDAVPDTVRDHYRLLSAHASDCIGCRRCETRCPFGVSVASRMKETAALFGF